MDGTLVDSEKLWDISLSALYESLGGSMSRETRTALVGASADETMATVYAELGLELDPRAMADSIRWLHEHTAGLFDDGLRGATAPATCWKRLRPTAPRWRW